MKPRHEDGEHVAYLVGLVAEWMAAMKPRHEDGEHIYSNLPVLTWSNSVSCESWADSPRPAQEYSVFKEQMGSSQGSERS